VAADRQRVVVRWGGEGAASTTGGQRVGQEGGAMEVGGGEEAEAGGGDQRAREARKMMGVYNREIGLSTV
jgi:hypothetical protein